MPHDVLVVDDDGAVRELLCKALARSGFRATGCATGEHALSLARTSCYDAVLIDHDLPGMTGTETTKELHVLCPRSVIIGMSGGHSGEGFPRAGGDLFLHKPFNISHVVLYLQARLS